MTRPADLPSLVILSGGPSGQRFALTPGMTYRIGRGLECQIVLTDPLASRVHCLLVREPIGWVVIDQESRNGTYLGGRTVTRQRLRSGDVIEVGSTKLRFEPPGQEPFEAEDEAEEAALERTQQVTFERPVSVRDSSESLRPKTTGRTSQDLLLLHELAIQLLAADRPEDVARHTLKMLQSRCDASVVGYLWASEAGRLVPKTILPEDLAQHVRLSPKLTQTVLTGRQAIRVTCCDDAAKRELREFDEAVCVPLLDDKLPLGAVHLYRRRGGFSDADFELAIAAANLMSLALRRSQRAVTLDEDRRRLAWKSADADDLIGESAPMRELKSRIARVARATGCVLIRGESGCGKELVARALHRTSSRADRPLLTVNCAALPTELMESQLFGHRRGAFTGADSDHQGFFQQADTGTLFLDEVGELSLEGQAKLLRILEGHPFLPVGGSKEVRVDVRVIAATNRDLREFVRARSFREDLYYRLTVFELLLPPLRERGPDVAKLIDHFLEHFRAQHGRPTLELSDPARQRLLTYSWPGNVRQLRNVIDSAVVLAEGQQIQPDDLGLRDTRSGESVLETLRIDQWEAQLIRKALDRTGGNVAEAARLLGIGRATLYRKLEALPERS